MNTEAKYVAHAAQAAGKESNPPNLEDPRVVLSLLESDQVVATKRRTHFGQRKLSFGIRALLWSLRIYVVIMILLAMISILRVTHVIQ